MSHPMQMVADRDTPATQLWAHTALRYTRVNIACQMQAGAGNMQNICECMGKCAVLKNNKYMGSRNSIFDGKHSFDAWSHLLH